MMDSTTIRSFLSLSRLAAFVLIVAILHWGEALLVPLALAALLTFMLGPLVKWLVRLHAPRVLAVVLVTVTAFGALTAVAWLLGRQVHKLAMELPQHRQTIQRRIDSVRAIGETGPIAKFREFINFAPQSNESTKSANPKPSPTVPEKEAEEAKDSPNLPTLESDTEPKAEPSSEPKAEPPAPPKDTSSSPTGVLGRAVNFILNTLGDALGTAGLVILFVIFMLLRQDDISRRLISLVGFSRLTVTTKAIDEAGDRISRYLLMQFFINGFYGLLLAVALAWIGLPYVILWGVLAAIFRFIPYIGPWIVAILPVSLSFAVFEGWTEPLQVIAIIATLELVTNMFIEPTLYGQSTGVSDFSLLIAITFWTWLWGGLGLLLATPLTVCLVVLCKYIPSMEWVGLLMEEKVVSPPHLQLYQRILADDETAALSLIQDMSEDKGSLETLDTTIVPALIMARREAVLGKLDKNEEEEFYVTLRTATSLLYAEQKVAPVKAEEATSESDEPVTDTPAAPVRKIMARALNGAADTLVLHFLSQTLPPTLALEVSAAPQLTGEWMDRIVEEQPALICISATPPGSQLAAAVLCRRLRSRLPAARILVCRWISPGQDFNPKPLRDAGANLVASSMSEATKLITLEIG
jgi:predicted PurR-regulated permease PerM